MDTLNSTDMVIHTHADGSSVGGFKIDTILGNSMMKGGGNIKKMKELGVPAGLLTMQTPNTEKYTEIVSKDLIVEDTLYEKLLSLAQETESKKSPYKKTRRNRLYAKENNKNTKKTPISYSKYHD